MEKNISIAVYTLDLPQYACPVLRIIEPARAAGNVELLWGAQSDGVNYAIHDDAMDAADLVLFQRYFPMQETWPLVAKALGSGKPVVYDLDDQLLDVPAAHPLRGKLEQCAPFAEKLLKRAHLVTVSTPELKTAFAPLNESIQVLPNRIPDALWPKRPAPALADGGPLRVGFAGTASHAPDLKTVEAPLAKIAEQFKERVQFVFYGCAPDGMDFLKAQVVAFESDYAGYARRLPGLGLHAAIAPLAENAFNRAKSDIKWQEYSLCAIPGVYAALPPYTQSVEHGGTGFLAHDEQEWFEALEALLNDEALRLDMARDASLAVRERHMLSLQSRETSAMWRKLILQGGRS